MKVASTLLLLCAVGFIGTSVVACSASLGTDASDDRTVTKKSTVSQDRNGDTVQKTTTETRTTN